MNFLSFSVDLYLGVDERLDSDNICGSLELLIVGEVGE